MNYKAKLDFIGKHYKIPNFDNLSLNEKSDACKAVTGKYTLEDALKHAQSNGKAAGGVMSTSATVEKPKSVEIIPPGGSTSNVAHKVDVAAPNINVNIPAPVVTVSHGNFTWQHNLRQALLWFNGVVIGALGMALLFMASAR